MRIKISQNKSFLGKIASFFKNKKVIIISSILFVFVAAGGAVTGILWKKGILKKVEKNLPYVIEGVVLNSPERITIDIKFKNYQKLSKKREEALKMKHLVSTEDDYVPAVITHRDKKINVQLRLKGDQIHDHLTGDKWSFRVKVRGEDTLFGMRRFSLHRPVARFYVSEWAFHKMLEHEGLMSLRYDFINVAVNGKDLGLYAIEEHFGKHLVENNRLREGIIIQFDDDLFYGSWNHNTGSSLGHVGRGLGYHSVEMRPYELGRILKNPELRKQFERANELAARFRAGELKLSEAYDIEKAAKYYALCDLTGATHNVSFPNFKTYYNPVTSRLEPIGFDVANALTGVRRLVGEQYMRMQQEVDNYAWDRVLRFWDDEEFAREYLHQLERMSQAEFVDQLIADIEKPLKEKIAILWNLGLKEGIRAQSFEYVQKILHSNAESIRKKLTTLKGTHAYFSKFDNNKLILSMGNIETLPMEVEKVTYHGTVVAEPKEPLILRPKRYYSPVRFEHYALDVPESVKWRDEMVGDLVIHYSVLGTSHKMQDKVFEWDYLNDDFFKEDFMRRKPNFREFDFFIISPTTKTIHIKPGRWTVKKDIIIPAGWQVLARGGVTLDLKNKAKILSYSPFEWIGTEDEQVQLISEDQTGQGLVIMNTKRPSTFIYVVFKNLSNPEHAGWFLTGAVTFYEAEVHIAQSQFLNSRAEDSLNIIRSKFTLKDSLFQDTARDAIDLDFAYGNITSVAFLNSGNDAIDFSGSKSIVRNSIIEQAKDKGVSIGEKSDVSLFDVVIKDCGIGIAGKDSSQIVVHGAYISKSRHGIAVYQKKSEFGPVKMTVKGLSLEEVGHPYMVEAKSELTVAGEKITTDQNEVEEFLLTLN